MTDEAYSELIAEITRPKSAEEKEFIKLGWKIMEAKYRYYILDAPVLQDHEYDQMERRYDELAKLLGKPPSAADMVGFDRNRPCAGIIMDKVDGRNAPEESNGSRERDRGNQSPSEGVFQGSEERLESGSLVEHAQPELRMCPNGPDSGGTCVESTQVHRDSEG